MSVLPLETEFVFSDSDAFKSLDLYQLQNKDSAMSGAGGRAGVSTTASLRKNITILQATTVFQGFNIFQGLLTCLLLDGLWGPKRNQ